MMMDVISFIVSIFCNVFRAVLAYLAYKKKITAPKLQLKAAIL